jgi:hypothetical protein
LQSPDEALAWLAAERQALLAAISQAGKLGFDRHVWQLAWAVWLFRDRQRHRLLRVPPPPVGTAADAPASSTNLWVIL